MFFGLNMNELQTYRERVNAVTVDDVQRAARNYLRPDRLTIVLVGDASAFVKQLPGAGFDKFEVDSRRRSSTCPRRLAAKGAGDTRRLPARVLRRAARPRRRRRRKRCSTRRLPPGAAWRSSRSIKTVRAEGTMTYATAGSPVDVSVRRATIEYPSKFRIDAVDARRQHRRRCTPMASSGSMSGAGAKVLDEAARRPDSRRRRARHGPRLLTRAAAGKLIVRTVDAGADEDPLVAAIELSGDGLSPVTLVHQSRPTA